MVILSPVGAGTPRKPRHGSRAAAQGNRACSAFLDFLDFGVDHVVVARRLTGYVRCAAGTTGAAPPPVSPAAGLAPPPRAPPPPPPSLPAPAAAPWAACAAWDSAYIFSPSFWLAAISAVDLSAIASLSSPLRASSRAFTAAAIASFSPASSLSPC